MTKIRVTNRKPASPNAAGEKEPSSQRTMGASNLASYRPLNTCAGNSNDDYVDSQFQKPPVRIPVRSITLAVFLCFAGAMLLVLGIMVLTGHLDSKFADRIWPMVIMGFLMFIPGSYHVRIAYCAYKGYPGYSFEDIPEFE